MCYALPGKVIAKDSNYATVDYNGQHCKIRVFGDEANIGDFVYAQGGVVVNTIPESEAMEVIETWKEMLDALRKTDHKMVFGSTRPVKRPMRDAVDCMGENSRLDPAQMRQLLQETNSVALSELYRKANRLRYQLHGNACCVHGIIEFSNICRCHCRYCGIREGASITRYRMSPDEIVEAADYAADELGLKALVLQSGEDLWYDRAKLIEIVSRISRLKVLVFLSIGMRSRQTYQALFDVGARAALLRFETANEEQFQRCRPGTQLSQRLELLQFLKQTGYVTATGFMIGLPGENLEDLINNILLTRSLEPEMYSFGPFIPVRGTPYQNAACADVEAVLKCIAATRLACPEANILVTTALETLDASARQRALLAGANSIMINVTPKRFRRLYRIYDGRAGADAEPRKAAEQSMNDLQGLGRVPTNLGFMLSWRKNP